MKIRTFTTLLVAQCLAAGVVAAECSHDAAPEMPDGKTAKIEQMAASQGEIKKYMASVEAYLACMDAAIPTVEDPEAQQQMLDTRNGKVTDMEAVAASFNEQIKAYKAASK